MGNNTLACKDIKLMEYGLFTSGRAFISPTRG